ncbi:MAG: CDP-glycerol glycerophosphotransferase family protein [Selenomonadaceae bacterium]|nr:CDP-glycerol glycerophosphotransferase family protein [Selenomonadaceae bacterium]
MSEENFKNKTWQDFKLECQSKKVILYGLGSLLNNLFLRVNEKISIIAAVDNDKSKQGHKLGEFFNEIDLQEASEILISSPKILDSYNPNEVVILISSLRYSEGIIQDLANEKFFNCFSVLHLEFNYKESLRKKNLPVDDTNNYIREYAKFCAENFPIQKNKIIFGGMDRYPEHGRAITEQLLKLDKNLEIIWLTNTPNIFCPKNVKLIYEGKWKNFIYELETAKFWILNMPLRVQAIKREEQIYIQVKHWSSITLKKFYLNEEVNDFEREIWKQNGDLIDFMISGSEFDEKTCQRGFNFHKKFLRFGSPRSDILFDPQPCREKIFDLYNLDRNEKILLYAPTFRANSQFQDLNYELLLKLLRKKFGAEWKIFVKFHPSMKNFSAIENESVINVSNYANGQELIAAADIMISDYSSIMFESAYVLKPVFLYAPDKDEYIKSEREFFIDYDSLPFPIAMTNDELSRQIEIFDIDKYRRDVKNFLNRYGVNEDGQASERTAKFIIDKIGENDG